MLLVFRRWMMVGSLAARHVYGRSSVTQSGKKPNLLDLCGEDCFLGCLATSVNRTVGGFVAYTRRFALTLMYAFCFPKQTLLEFKVTF